MRPDPNATPYYRERLWAPPHWWLLGLLFTAAVWLVYQHPYGPRVSVPASLAALGLAAIVLVSYSRAIVAVERDTLVAGRARLPLSAVGGVEVLDAIQARNTRGPGSDPRAYLLSRSYIGTAVRVTVDDPADPVPYWYVSTRHPEQIGRAHV